MVKDEVTRKAMAGFAVASEDTIVGSHEVVRRTFGAMLGAMMGQEDPSQRPQGAQEPQGLHGNDGISVHTT
jgi:hypothetical protein